MVAFSGRMYWTSNDEEVLCYWDSATGQIHRLNYYHPALPDEAHNGWGLMSPTADGRILARIDQSGGSDPKPFAVVLDADLNPTTAEVWSAPVTGAPYYAEGRYCSGLVLDGQTWLHWYPPSGSYVEQAGWVRLDSSGTIVEEAAVWPDGNEQGSGWGVSYVVRDGFLYRGLNANEGTFDRFSPSTGTWERAVIQRPTGIDGGIVFVGITDSGDFVFTDDLTSEGDYRDKRIWVVHEADLNWSSGIFNHYPLTNIGGSVPALDWPMDPPGKAVTDYYVTGLAGGNTVIVLGGFAYFSTVGISGEDYYWNDDGTAYGNVGTVWEMNLADGTREVLFQIPFGGYDVEGNYIGLQSDPDRWSTISGYAMGLLSGTGPTSFGRMRVNIGDDNDRQWKYFNPKPGENGGVGVGFINVGDDDNRDWREVRTLVNELQLNAGDDDTRDWVAANK